MSDFPRIDPQCRAQGRGVSAWTKIKNKIISQRQHDKRAKSGAFHSQLFVCPRLLALNMIWAGESYQWVRTRGRSPTNWSLGVKYCDSTSYSSSSSYVCPYSGLANFTLRQAAKALPAMCASVYICLNAGLAGIISALRWQFISILGRSAYPRTNMRRQQCQEDTCARSRCNKRCHTWFCASTSSTCFHTYF